MAGLQAAKQTPPRNAELGRKKKEYQARWDWGIRVGVVPGLCKRKVWLTGRDAMPPQLAAL